MNEIDTSTLDGKIAVMTAFKEGRKIQCFEHDLPKSKWNDFGNAAEPAWNWRDYDYRIKPLEFPKLPDHLQWHNPAGFTPEQFEKDWRPITKQELPGDDCLGLGNKGIIVEKWNGASWDSNCGTGWGGCCSEEIYRVPLSTPFPEPPKPKVMVPLEPSDILPTDVLRQKPIKYPFQEHWMKIDAVNSDGPAVHFAGSGRIRIPFKTLMNEWEISRDGAKTWSPCEKESES